TYKAPSSDMSVAQSQVETGCDELYHDVYVDYHIRSGRKLSVVNAKLGQQLCGRIHPMLQSTNNIAISEQN
ncbi:hypothetical protein J6590_103778, partial [Homalodisca vitripennis]